jgi:hypothetical protein
LTDEYVQGRQADRYENLAMLYRRLAVRRGPRPRGDIGIL